MSDLFCAATLVVARHADAEYVETWFSDEGGTLTTLGRKQALELGDSLASARISRVWCSDSSRAVQTAELAASRLGTGVVARKELREIGIGDLLGKPFDVEAVRAVTDRWADGDLDARFTGGESGRDVVDRYRDQLGAIADQHRGETVLVVAHESAACVALTTLAGNVAPPYDDRLRRLRNGETAVLMLDADGGRLLRWGDLSLD
ncbi:histidine phosphatase family protein [Nocardioides terrisoli]|uniref:histidine phosphatase family protein n=1 Tax=Nocardioides terrisoli TaxID=3388267 RepID=UPI00287BA224|nr:histidine phosphatase family protein [Nocardioides marmorisolisilvae]